MLFLDDGFDDGALRLQCAAKVQDIALEYGDLEDHLLFLFGEDLGLDEVELLADVVEAGEAGVEEDLEEMMEQVGWRFFEEELAPTFALKQLIKELGQLVDVLLVAGDEVVLCEDDVELASIGGPVLHVEERDMDREEEAVLVLDDLGLVRRRDELLDGQGMDVEVFLQVGDIVVLRILKIDPGDVLVLDGFHVCFSIRIIAIRMLRITSEYYEF